MSEVWNSLLLYVVPLVMHVVLVLSWPVLSISPKAGILDSSLHRKGSGPRIGNIPFGPTGREGQSSMLTQIACPLKSSGCSVNFGFGGHDVVTHVVADDIMLARLNQQAGPLENRPHWTCSMLLNT